MIQSANRPSDAPITGTLIVIFQKVDSNVGIMTLTNGNFTKYMKRTHTSSGWTEWKEL